METIPPFENLEVDPSALPRVEEVSYHPLEPRFVYVLVIQTLMAWTVVLGLTWFVYLMMEAPERMGLFYILSAVIILLATVNLSWLKRACRQRGFAVRQRDITYKKGIIISRVISVPYNKIQQVTVSQNIVFRLVGLYTLKLHSAAQISDGVNVFGLTKEQAEGIKALILEKIS